MTLRRIKRSLVLAALLAAALILVAASPSAAATNETVANTAGAGAIVFAPSWVQLLTLAVTVVLPLLVGLVTKRTTDGGRKAVYLAVLAALTGLGSELLAAISDGQTYDLAAGLYTALTALVFAIALHYGVYKPTGLAGKAADVGTAPEHRA